MNIDLPKPKQDYKVDVLCATYNQSKYIVDTLNGFTMQQTNFPFVCLIYDDASTDGEQEVIKKYLDDYFEMDTAEIADTSIAYTIIAIHKTNKNCTFAVHFLKENHYQQKKSRIPYFKLWRERCEYEALCEGDDYWTDPIKLQFQYDFMETHSDYAMCFHNAFVEEFASTKHSARLFNEFYSYRDLEVEDVVERWVIPTASIFAKTRLIELPNPFPEIYSGDYSLALKLFMNGKIAYLNRTCSVYRMVINGNSVSVQSKYDVAFVESEHIKVVESFKEQTHGEYDKYLNEVLRRMRRRKSVFEHVRKKRWWFVLFYPEYIVKVVSRGNIKYWISKMFGK